MNADSLIGVNLLYIILFIVPGLVGIKFYRREADVLDNDDRIDAIVYSILLSISSFYIIYTADWLLSGSALTSEDFTPFSLENFYWGYLGVLLTAVATGSLYGRYRYHLVNNESFSTRRDPFVKGVFTVTPDIGAYRLLKHLRHKIERMKNWAIKAVGLQDLFSEFHTHVWRPFFDGDSSTSTAVWDQVFEEIDGTVRVTTTKGDEITGRVLDSGSFAQTRDLLLSIENSPTGASEPWTWEEMDYVYVHSQDISHIGIEDVDLDRKIIAEIEGDGDRDVEVSDETDFNPTDSSKGKPEAEPTGTQYFLEAELIDDELMETLFEEVGVDADDFDSNDIENYETLFSKLREELDVDDEVRQQLEAMGELGED